MYTLVIDYGAETMAANELGYIARSNVLPSRDWRIVGAVERNNFGHVTRRYSLAEVMQQAGAIPWRYKNGRQRVFILDYDHGTRREWGSPNYSLRVAPANWNPFQ